MDILKVLRGIFKVLWEYVEIALAYFEFESISVFIRSTFGFIGFILRYIGTTL